MAKILLVEDDRNLGSLTKTALSKKGHDVFLYNNAQKAIDQASGLKPDIFLMDIMLPELSGAEAVRLLKKNALLKDVPVVFLTGLISSGEDDLENTGITIDEVNYRTLGKPYEIDHLTKLVDEVLSKARRSS